MAYPETETGRRAVALKRHIRMLVADCTAHVQALQVVQDHVAFASAKAGSVSSSHGYDDVQPSFQQQMRVFAPLADMCSSSFVDRQRSIHERLNALARGDIAALIDKRAAATGVGLDDGDDVEEEEEEEEDDEAQANASLSIRGDGIERAPPAQLYDADQEKHVDADAELVVQARNEYAVQVLARVEHKLSGQRDPNAPVCSVEEQVGRSVPTCFLHCLSFCVAAL